MSVELSVQLAKSGEAVKAGPIGLAVILIMCIGCYFLFKSMSKHLKNVRENFPVESGPGVPAAVVVATPVTVVKRVPTTTDEDGHAVAPD